MYKNFSYINLNKNKIDVNAVIGWSL